MEKKKLHWGIVNAGEKGNLMESALTFDQYNGLQQLCASTLHCVGNAEGEMANVFVHFSLWFSLFTRGTVQLGGQTFNVAPPKIRLCLMSTESFH